MKKITYLVILLFFGFSAFAQNSDAELKKGDWMFSINFGVGSYIGTSAPAPNLPSYSVSESSAISQAWFDKKPILDVEARWFLTNDWALKISGGISFGHTPGRSELIGTGTEEGDIPTYKAVPSGDNMQFAVTVGADRYFTTPLPGLFWRIGGEAGYAYGRVEQKANTDEYLGKSLGEAYSIKVAPVAGVDYFFNSVMFLGLEARPVAYQYTMYNVRPQEGLSLLKANNNTFSFISQPTIKLGVKF